MKREKGIVGCVTCGTSLGCFFPLGLVLGLALIVGISNYFDSSYYWEDFDTGMVIALAVVVIPAVLVGLVQAAVGIWSWAGFFDNNITQDELNLLTPIPSVDEEDKDNV